MTQASMVIDNGPGLNVRQDINAAFAALSSSNGGAIEPAEMHAGMVWNDLGIAGAPDGILRMRNNANSAWIPLATALGTYLLNDGTIAAPGLAWKNEPGLGFYRSSSGVLRLAAQGGDAFVFNTSAAASTTFVTVPRSANGTSNLEVRNQPVGAPAYNNMFFSMNTDGTGIIRATAVGTAGKGIYYDATRHDFAGPLAGNSTIYATGNITSTTGFQNTGSYDAGGGNMAANTFEMTNVKGWNIRARGYVTATRALWQLIIGDPAAQIFEFHDNGTAQKNAGSTAWVVTSDARLKESVAPYGGGLDQIIALDPVTFHRKADPVADRREIGLIAQDAEGVMPEIVMANPGMIDGEEVPDVRALDAGPITFALINAVKTLAGRVATLEGAQA